MAEKMHCKIKIFVLSLADETERRQQIETQLKDFSHEWQFFDAVDLRHPSISLPSLYDEDLVLRRYGRNLTRGEVGCAMSHRSICQKIIENNIDLGLVLEDDALVSSSLENFIEKVISEPSVDFDCLLLGYSKLDKANEFRFYQFEPLKERIKLGNYSIGEPWKNWTSGTVGYLITQAGARKIMASENVVALADDWNYFVHKLSLKVLHMRPLIVFEDFQSFRSSIEGDRSKVAKQYKAHLDFLRWVRGYARKFAMVFR